MLRKLKNKFVLINTLMVGVVLVLIVLSIFIVTLYQSIKEEKRALGDILNGFEPETETRYALVLVGDEGSSILESSLNISDDEIKHCAQIAAKESKSDGINIRRTIVFKTKNTEQGTLVAFSSLLPIASDAESVFRNTSAIAAGALFLLFLLSRRLANVVMKPTEEAWENQKRFIADASHDLKTPLTVIMANNDILLSHPEKTVDEQIKWVESTKNEGEYMSSMINKMLELAKSEDLISKLELSDVCISELTEKAVLQFEPVAFESEIMIDSQIDSDITVKSNSEEYYRLIQILIDNAVKYSKAGQSVFVSLTSGKKGCTLSVKNLGDVIEPEKLEHIFDRFYRVDDARSKGSFGLGLSIAKNVANALGGEISAQSDAQNGTVFTVKFKY